MVPFLYNMSRQCDNTDVEIVNLYLGTKLANILCGMHTTKVCSVRVDKAQCVFRKVSYSTKSYVTYHVTHHSSNKSDVTSHATDSESNKCYVTSMFKVTIVT